MIKTLQAVSVGCKVPEDPFQATVHSVFRSAANLSVVGLDYLLVVLASDDTDLPQGIRLAGNETRFFSDLRPGQEAWCQTGSLHVAGSDMEIDLNGSRRYGSDLGWAQSPARQEDIKLNWQIAWQALVERQRALQTDLGVDGLEVPGSHSLAGRRAVEQIKMLVQASRELDSVLARSAVKSLVGLGLGLTPSGDDMLVGFQSGILASSGKQTRRGRWVNRMSRLLEEYSQGTNDISRSYLVLAARGFFSSTLLNLAASICSGASEDQVRASAEHVFQTGQTSGMDAASGLLAGLSVWMDDLDEPFLNNSSTG